MPIQTSFVKPVKLQNANYLEQTNGFKKVISLGTTWK